MKILMLGWEFPPHISGGLGTACYGLTQGLAKQGIDVSFVVPKVYGDEDLSAVELIGCNRLRRNGKRSRDLDPLLASQAQGQAQGLGQEYGAMSGLLELIAVDSALGPYLTEEEYQRRMERLRACGKDKPAGQLDAALLSEVRAAWRKVIEDAAASSGGGGSGEWTDEVLKEGQTFEFSGVYGPDLLTEVARYAIAVAQVAEDRQFDLIHAHDWMTYPAGLVAARISKKPLVVHMHATEYDRSGENVNSMVRDLEQLGLDGADLVVPVSHLTSSILQQRYRTPRDKIRVVHNAVSQPEGGPDRGDWTKQIEEPIVLFLGRVTFQKGPDYFLEAAARVIEIVPKVKFVLAGSGDMLAPMIERAARLGLARHLHFPGFLKGRDVDRMYAMADIYVMPSVSEPFGISPLEAMAQDVPVIVSRQSGVSEVLANALKVDFWDVDGIADKILALLKYSALRQQLLAEGRDEVRGFRWEVPAQKVCNVYRELVG